jgi:ATP-dependent helicase/nuclease subunit B
LAILSRAGADAAEEFREEMAPAIDRVWGDEVSAVMRDLRGWIRRMATDGSEWVARYVELGFGLHAHPDRDAASGQEPVLIDGRYPLRGAIDLVEIHRTSGALRVTDHKTGRNRTVDGLAIGGGATLQPLLYAEAAEQVLAAPVSETRLFFCTVAGGYGERAVPLTAQNRRLGIEALEIIDRAIETGVLVPAPAEGACARCDFVGVCGPTAAEHAGRKTTGLLRDLDALRRQK